MSKRAIYYFLSAVLVAIGAYLLIAGYDDFVAGEISTSVYVLRGLGPLLMVVALVVLARDLDKGGKPDA